MLVLRSLNRENSLELDFFCFGHSFIEFHFHSADFLSLKNLENSNK